MDEGLLKVYMFGEFRLEYKDVTVGGGSSRSKLWNLLAYLLCNRHRTITQPELIRLLDYGKENPDPVRMLRNVRFNVRRTLAPLSQALGRDPVSLINGVYGWDNEIKVEVDAERFESLCREAQRTEDTQRECELLGQALELWRGEYLAQLTGEFWVDPLQAYYHDLYLGALCRRALLLNENGEPAEAEKLCRGAIKNAPYYEPIHRELIRSLLLLERREEAAAVYNALRERLLSELGVEPERETVEIYREAIYRNGDGVLSVDDIREQLREHDIPAQAILCSFDEFKYLYRLEARSADRRGDAIHIGILSVSDRTGSPLSGRGLTQAMTQLQEQIQNTLRVGDIVSCCSASQFIIMLVQANYENSERVCRRVIEAYERSHPRSSARVQSTVLPLEPLLEMHNPSRRW